MIIINLATCSMNRFLVEYVVFESDEEYNIP